MLTAGCAGRRRRFARQALPAAAARARRLREPASATVLAGRLGESRQSVNYHPRELERAGLVELVEERRRRGCTERVMRARARVVVVDPDVVGDLDAVAETQDRFASDVLLALAARTVGDVAAMRERAGPHSRRLVTFAIEAGVGFERPADIERFADELAERVAELAAEFGCGESRRRFRLIAGAYPKPKEAA
jgi:DNA-binding transcriptional ArsR family regulator